MSLLIVFSRLEGANDWKSVEYGLYSVTVCYRGQFYNQKWVTAISCGLSHAQAGAIASAWQNNKLKTWLQVEDVFHFSHRRRAPKQETLEAYHCQKWKTKRWQKGLWAHAQRTHPCTAHKRLKQALLMSARQVFICLREQVYSLWGKEKIIYWAGHIMGSWLTNPVPTNSLLLVCKNWSDLFSGINHIYSYDGHGWLHPLGTKNNKHPYHKLSQSSSVCMEVLVVCLQLFFARNIWQLYAAILEHHHGKLVCQ